MRIISQRLTPLHYKDLIKVFERLGLKVERTEGDHYIMSKSGMKRPVVIQAKKQIPVDHIVKNMKAANISREEYFKALEQV